MGLVGENVALICCGIAQATGITRLVYGGATLHENPALVATLQAVSVGMGNAAIFLDEGSFAGAAGALERSANA
jgi:pantothenate kinase